jgi:hypothetical protein
MWNVYKFIKQAADNGEVTNLNQMPYRICKKTVFHDHPPTKSQKKEIIPYRTHIYVLNLTLLSHLQLKSNTNVTDIDEAARRRIIHDFHRTEKKSVTPKRLHKKVESKLGFKRGVTGVRKLTHKLHSRWQRTQDNRKMPMEHHDVKALRMNYLRQIQ